MNKIIELFGTPGNGIVLLIGLAISIILGWRYRKTHARNLLNSLPGVWTSLGLLGTFFSICWSLHGIASEPREVIDNVGKVWSEAHAIGSHNLDIKVIIGDLIPAFTTSIIGLIGALLSTICAKWIFANEDDRENINLGYESPEDMIKQLILNTNHLTSQYDIILGQKLILEELVGLQKQQQERSREYNDRLNENIGHQSEILKEFIEGFVNRMDDIFKQMHGAIQQQVKTFGEEQFSKTSEIITNITDKLSSISGDLIAKQQSSVESIMSNTAQEVQLLTKELASTLNAVSDEVKDSFTNLQSEQTQKLNAMIANYDNLATKLSEQNSSFAEKLTEQMNQEYAMMKQQNIDSIRQMADIRLSYQEATSDVMKETLQTIGNMMHKTHDEMDTISTKTVEALADVSKDVQGSLSKLEAEQSLRLNRIVTNYDNLATRLTEQNTTFAEQMNTQLQAEYAKVEQHNVQSLQQMVDLRNAYQEATSDMVQSTLDMNQQVTAQLRESLSEFISELEKSVSANCHSLSSSITENVEALEKSYRFVQSLVAEIRQNYDQAVLSYGDAVNVAHRNNEASERALKATAKSLESVQETNERIGELLKFLKVRQDNLEQLSKHIHSIGGAIIELQRLESTLNKILNK